MVLVAFEQVKLCALQKSDPVYSDFNLEMNMILTIGRIFDS
jgi:hypothetical protein